MQHEVILVGHQRSMTCKAYNWLCDQMQYWKARMISYVIDTVENVKHLRVCLCFVFDAPLIEIRARKLNVFVVSPF